MPPLQDRPEATAYPTSMLKPNRPLADAELPGPFAERRRLLRDAQRAINAGNAARAQDLLTQDATVRARCVTRLRP
jgi:hypothetical protein